VRFDGLDVDCGTLTPASVEARADDDAGSKPSEVSMSRSENPGVAAAFW
jgi:hypothetical protein